MKKQEIINYIAQNAGLSKKDSAAALSSFVECVKLSIKNGNSTKLVGFGTFSVSKRSARKGRNPQTGVVIDIPARRVPVFKAGKAFKQGLIEPSPGHDNDGGIGG